MRYITEKGGSPIYLQLYRQIRNDIVAGVYPYGSKLPSKRTLADESGISTVTVEHAYALLCDEGYARARERSGYTVVFKRSDGFVSTAESGAEHIRQSAEPSDYPTFPVSVLSRTMRRVRCVPPQPLVYGLRFRPAWRSSPFCGVMLFDFTGSALRRKVRG